VLGRKYFRPVVVSLLLSAAPCLLCAQTSGANSAISLVAVPAQRIDATNFALRAPSAANISRTPFNPGGISLRELARAAGTIFSGTVMSITTSPSNPSATPGASVATITITFRVDQAFRGANSGESIAIRQWVGLWSSGQRYRVGERVLLFLYPPSKLGLTSCVAGTFGRFSVDSLGRVALTDQHVAAFRADPLLGGSSRVVTLADFAQALHRAAGEE
jgi:hypothetical protein